MKRLLIHEVHLEFVGGISGFTVGFWDYGLDRRAAAIMLPLVRERRTQASFLWIETQYAVPSRR